jgi:hypothetical protein
MKEKMGKTYLVPLVSMCRTFFDICWLSFGERCFAYGKNGIGNLSEGALRI